MVHGVDHGVGAAEVFVQGVVVACGGPAGFQVGKDVGAAERIDGLLGVTDHEPASAFLPFIECGKDPVLSRVGILEFVDQCHRELVADDLCQTLTVAAFQGIVQAAEHIVEAHGGGLATDLIHAPVDPGGGMGKQVGAGQLRVRPAIHHRIQLLAEGKVRAVILPGLGELHASMGKLCQGVVGLVVESFTVGVALQGLQHAGQAGGAVAVAVEPFVIAGSAHPFEKVRQFVGQLLAGLLILVCLRAGLGEPVCDALR